MKKNVRLQVAKYVFFDGLAAILAYTLLYYFRKTVIESSKLGFELNIIFDSRYLFGLAATTLFWLMIYWITGFYEDIFCVEEEAWSNGQSHNELSNSCRNNSSSQQSQSNDVGHVQT